MDKVDKLYQNYDILADPKNKPSEHEVLYLEIIQAVKGSTSEKMLACQFIPRFLKDFPELQETALDAQLDLVEDADIAIRKHAVKYLPSFCKESIAFITKISDILTQLLQSEDTGELATVHTALMTILKIDIKLTLEGMFVQIATTEEDTIRKRAIQFLCTKFKFLPPELTTKEVEEFVLEKCKAVFPEIGGDDFLNLMPLLSNLKIAKTIPVQQTLVYLIAEQAELDAEFQPSPDNVAGFLQCVRLALPYFSAFIHSTDFVTYICLFVVTKLKEIEQLEGGSELSLDVIKLLAEISPYLTAYEQSKECTEVIHKVLLEYIPLPPPPTDAENGTQSDEPDLKFTHIECLLFVFTHFLKHCPEFLTAADNLQRFKDLKARLQFLARGVQNGIKTFRESLVSNKTKETKAEETKLKAIALRTMNNINSLIKDLFRIPPTFKTAVTLSWKPATAASTKVPVTAGIKRESDGIVSVEKKSAKRDSKSVRELYQPPGGKYSTNVNFSQSRGSNFYSRGRGKRFY
ncbi:apoptosis inhibitor 5 [Trichonephila inaurata madagascariensis]|uniref:Apoptosis inhibitor 5 n=1 Tax=Trichonephila inaurata madagascariensis TaxID=2747483 RepID=A0A8X7CI36_9ARAC|nr:apoptosis inhibitor 5 [Trichonephila inaurata madagascariensis]